MRHTYWFLDWSLSACCWPLWWRPLQQERLNDRERSRVLGVLIHGDAAFAGEGIVQETLNLAKLPGYSIGGVLHVVVNNQLGFTTPPEEGRSTVYATDVIFVSLNKGLAHGPRTLPH